MKYAVSAPLFLLSLTLTLLLTEVLLRWKGIKPGIRANYGAFTTVDSVVVLDGFYTDSNGILCIAGSVHDFLCNGQKTPEQILDFAGTQAPEIAFFINSLLEIHNAGYHNQFKSFLKEITVAPDSSDIDFFNAVQQYAACQVNAGGFRSIEFKKYNSNRKSILLLGDSFTWGHSASNLTNSFADLLLTKGYVVYNTGISGADPAQYLQLATVLVPILQPDFVVVNFYMGNDVQYFERKPLPHIPLMYHTNAGYIFSCPSGIYLGSAREAYNYTKAHLTIPTEFNRFNRLCAMSSTGTLLWRSLEKAGWADTELPQYQSIFSEIPKVTTEKPYSNIQLQQIREMTLQNSGRFLLIAIPKLRDNQFEYPESVPHLFEGLEYVVPPVKIKHYHPFTDGHFNDEGSRMYAEFIDRLVTN